MLLVNFMMGRKLTKEHGSLLLGELQAGFRGQGCLSLR